MSNLERLRAAFDELEVTARGPYRLDHEYADNGGRYEVIYGAGSFDDILEHMKPVLVDLLNLAPALFEAVDALKGLAYVALPVDVYEQRRLDTARDALKNLGYERENLK